MFILIILSAIFITSCDNSASDPSLQDLNDVSSNTASETFSSEEISLESIEEYSGQETVTLPFVPFD